MNDNDEKFSDSYIGRNSIKLIVEKDDPDFDEICKKFFKNLKKEYENFKKKIARKEQEWKDFKEKLKKVDTLNNKESPTFYPEILSRKSPLGIINAKWGIGKTYFIEKFTEKFLLNKLDGEKSFIEKVFIIDAWKYSASNNIPAEIIENILIKIYPRIQNEEFFTKIYNYLIQPLIIDRFRIEPPKKQTLKDKVTNNIDSIFNKINKKFRTKNSIFLFFIDNLERLGKDSWKVLKSIIKLSQLKNIIFIFPMHIEKMHNNKRVAESEFPIEKYVDLNVFNFDQNLKGLFTNLGFNNQICEDLEKIFKTEDNGYVLTIREIEKVILASELNKIPFTLKKYLLYERIYHKKIWGWWDDKLSLWKKIFSKETNEILECFKNTSRHFHKIEENFKVIVNKINYLDFYKKLNLDEWISKNRFNLFQFITKENNLNTNEMIFKINNTVQQYESTINEITQKIQTKIQVKGKQEKVIKRCETKLEYLESLDSEARDLEQKTILNLKMKQTVAEETKDKAQKEIDELNSRHQTVFKEDLKKDVDKNLQEIKNAEIAINEILLKVKNEFDEEIQKYFSEKDIWDLSWTSNDFLTNITKYLLDINIQ